jgi:formylmethanofuran dehydrogenase subunit E
MSTYGHELSSEQLDELVGFHGHMCPGLAMGVHAARIALTEIGPHAADEEVVAVTETDMCGVDAVQFMTGCTFGKGNLIHEDWGKNAFTFFRRSDGRAVRVAARPGAFARDPERGALMEKIRAGAATERERLRFGELQWSQSMEVLEMDPDELFEVRRFMGVPPPRARIHDTVICARCGEGVMATRVRDVDGVSLCTPCAAARERGEDEPTGDRQARRNLLEG